MDGQGRPSSWYMINRQKLAHILIIEDDPDLGPLLKLNLEREGYRVSLAIDGLSGQAKALSGGSDLIILDLMLPWLDGMDILKRLRRELDKTPVIILTAKGGESIRLEGFRAGCDDYVPKPFSLMELIARVRAVLRRCGHSETPGVIHSGGLLVDPHSRIAEINGQNVALAPKEFELLYILVSHPDQALSRTYLLDEVWGEEAEVSPRTVDNHVLSLRKKLNLEENGSGGIITVFKLGYMWAGG